MEPAAGLLSRIVASVEGWITPTSVRDWLDEHETAGPALFALVFVIGSLVGVGPAARPSAEGSITLKPGDLFSVEAGRESLRSVLATAPNHAAKAAHRPRIPSPHPHAPPSATTPLACKHAMCHRAETARRRH